MMGGIIPVTFVPLRGAATGDAYTTIGVLRFLNTIL
jgi:hypothetical protein